MAAARQASGPSLVPWVLIGALAAAGAAVWFGYPGLVLLVVGVAVAAFLAPPAILTGKKDANGFPTAVSTGEQTAMNRYRMWGELKWRILVPSMDWLPGWPLRMWWLVSIPLAGAALALPTPALGEWWRVANALGIFITVNVVNGSIRRWTAPDDPCDGPTTAVVIAEIRRGPKTIAAVIAASVLGVAAFVATVVAVDRLDFGFLIDPVQPWHLALALALAAALTVVTLATRTAALEEWRTLVRVRAEWAPRWQIAKLDPAPHLIDHAEFGSIQVDTFESHASIGSGAIYPLVGKITASMGSGARIAVLESPNLDSQGQPVQGSKHPLRFRVVTFVSDDMPDLNNPDVDGEQAELLIASAAAWVADATGAGRWVFLDASPLHRQGSAEQSEEDPEDEGEEAAGGTGAWVAHFAQPDGPDYSWMRNTARGDLAGAVGAEALVDHNAGELFFGSLTQGSTDFADKSMAKRLTNLALTDTWGTRWSNILKMGAVQPRPEHGVFAEAKVGGVTLYRQPFVVQQGMDPLDFFKLESKISTTLSAAPFVSVTGFSGTGDRPGERHPQAFCVTWGAQAVASNPDKLVPTEGLGPRWVLSGRMNEAFDAARLARPEVSDVRALTDKKSRSHVWEIKLRLHGGVTLAEVRAAAQKIRQHLGSDWLRVAEAQDGCTIVAGADPKDARKVVFARPEQKNRDYVTSLDWEQAFSDAKLQNSAGVLPRLVNSSVLPANTQVQVLDFALPAGTDRAMVKAATAKLQATTGNAFVEVRPSPLGADHVQMLISREHPLPSAADVDWEAIDCAADGVLLFATGIEGEPVGFNSKRDPHVLVAGASGGGKSVSLQVLLYAAAVAGAEIYLIDPTKGGADFQFVSPYSRAFAATVDEAAAVMKAVYAEVMRRKNLNATHGVGGYRELPDDIRPKHIYLVMDEFTSLMQPDPVSKIASDDPEVEREREMGIAANQQKAYIGTMAGKIAREARSAGVTLVLATQKLSAKMLDEIPGAGDLKALTMDTLLPVPVSAKFPTGWALNSELSTGDALYTPKGTTTPILGFTDTVTGRDVFALEFDDGQVVKTDAGHIWMVSDERSRKNASAGTNKSGERAAIALAALARVSANSWMSASELAELLGYATTARVVVMAEKFGVRRGMRDRLSGEVREYDRNSRRGTAPSLYFTTTALTVMKTPEPHLSFDAQDFITSTSGWATARELLAATVGSAVTSQAAGKLGTRLRLAEVPMRPQEHEPYLYEAEPFLRQAVSDFLTRTVTDDETGEPLGLYRLQTTESMMTTVNVRGNRSNWAVPSSDAIGGHDVDLLVDPYSLGAWLGDGSKSSGIITSSAVASCTDANGLTDQAHMIEQLRAGGFEARQLACSDNTVGTTGLKVKLRELGVLDNKHIPAAYLRASYAQRLALLQGLMDTDGSASTKGQCTIGQVQKELSLQIVELVRSLGIKPAQSNWPVGYVPLGETEKKITSTYYMVSFRTSLPVFRLPRKLAKIVVLPEASATNRRYIKSITRIESEPTRCIGVADPGHMFLVEGFIPTHNTNLARMLMGNATFGEKQSALKSATEAPELGDVVPKGRGLWESTEANAQIMQVWFEASQSTFAAKLSERRESLTANEKLDLSPFMRTHENPEDRAPARHPREFVGEPEVVTVGEFEFSLDDLDEDDILAAAPEQPEVSEVSVPIIEAPELAPSTTVVIAAYAADATAHAHRGPVVTLPQSRTTESDIHGWWKIDAALSVIELHPGTALVVWVDPELNDEDEIGIPYVELVRDALADAGMDVEAVVPERTVAAAPVAVNPAPPVAAPQARRTATPKQPDIESPDFGEPAPPRPQATVFDEFF